MCFMAPPAVDQPRPYAEPAKPPGQQEQVPAWMINAVTAQRQRRRLVGYKALHRSRRMASQSVQLESTSASGGSQLGGGGET